MSGEEENNMGKKQKGAARGASHNIANAKPAAEYAVRVGRDVSVRHCSNVDLRSGRRTGHRGSESGGRWAASQ